MGKGNKKHSKKGKKDDLSEDILDAASLSIKKFRKVTREIGKLSTGQKLVGGIALVAAGLAYLATKDTDQPRASSADSDSEATEAADEAEHAAVPARKSRKNHRTS